MKILHLADIHGQDKHFAEFTKCLDFIIDQAAEIKPDLIVHAGDTFDLRGIQLDSNTTKYMFDAFTRLANIAPVAIVIGTPFHDGHAAEVFSKINSDYPIHVSSYPEQIYLFENSFLSAEERMQMDAEPDATLSMVPTPTKQHFPSMASIQGTDSEIANAMTELFLGFGAGAVSDCPHVVVGHFQVAGSLISETQILTGVDIEISKDMIELARADLVCLGHIHKSQKIGDNIFYSGSIFRKTWGELEEKGFYLHDLSLWPRTETDEKDGKPPYLYSNFIQTPTRKLLKIKVDLTDREFLQDCKDQEIDCLLEPNTLDDIEGSHVRLEIKVFQDEQGIIDRETIKQAYDAYGAKGVGISLICIPRENVRAEEVLKQTTLRDKFIKRAELTEDDLKESLLLKLDTLENNSPEAVMDIVKAGIKVV